MASSSPRSPSGASAASDLWSLLGWMPDGRQLQQLAQLQELLRHWNRRLNLTRLVEGEDYWIAQVFDSLWPLLPLLPRGGDRGEGAVAQPTTAAGVQPAVPSELRVIDVGTGGGFPGLAAAIALPQARLTLVDSVGRKLDAVAQMARELGLDGRLTLRCERVERTGHRSECRGRYDLALARAVAAAPVVAEYLVPLLRPTGQALLYRGQWGEADQQDLEQALRLLGARIDRCQQRQLPAGKGLRTVLSVRPLRPCPDLYPRAVGVPSRLPLGREAAQPGRRGDGDWDQPEDGTAPD